MRGTEIERETLAQVFMQGVDAYNRRDFERFLPCFHPDIEYESLLTRVEGGDPYHGHDGLRRYWEDLTGGVEQSQFRVDRLEWIDDVLVATGQVTGHGRVSGAPFDYDCVQASRYRDGLISWCATHTTREAALAAARGE
jgi:ketosteroid isomerase-like protein